MWARDTVPEGAFSEGKMEKRNSAFNLSDRYDHRYTTRDIQGEGEGGEKEREGKERNLSLSLFIFEAIFRRRVCPCHDNMLAKPRPHVTVARAQSR